MNFCKQNNDPFPFNAKFILNDKQKKFQEISVSPFVFINAEMTETAKHNNYIDYGHILAGTINYVKRIFG